MSICSTTYSSRDTNVLGEEDALALNDEKVGELVDIADKGVDSLTGDGVVSAGAELGSDAVVKDKLAGSLGGDGNGQGHP